MSDDAERLHSGEAWRDFCRRLEASGEAILGAADEPRARAEGYRALTRLLVYATQLEVEAGDPLFPSFVRHQDPHNQWGGPNPDNVYLRAHVDPAHAYRVFARDARGLRQAIFSLHEGDMALREYGVYGERALDDLAPAADGSLELWISAEERPGNWIPMHPQARLFTIRVYQPDWERDAAPAFHIERVGAEGVPRPPLDPAALARALERSVRWVEASAAYWSALHRRRLGACHAERRRPAARGGRRRRRHRLRPLLLGAGRGRGAAARARAARGGLLELRRAHAALARVRRLRPAADESQRSAGARRRRRAGARGRGPSRSGRPQLDRHRRATARHARLPLRARAGCSRAAGRTAAARRAAREASRGPPRGRARGAPARPRAPPGARLAALPLMAWRHYL